MLVLSRKVGQRIWIDGEICIEVLECYGRYVRLGFTADKNHNIVREELMPKPNRKRTVDEPNEPAPETVT